MNLFKNLKYFFKSLFSYTEASNKELVLYYANWGIYGAQSFPEHIPWHKVTRCIYSFVKNDGAGNVFSSDPNADFGTNNAMGTFLEVAHEYNKPALISIGGWTYRDDLTQAIQNYKTNGFISNITKFITDTVPNSCKWTKGKKTPDGLDVDWELDWGSLTNDQVINFINMLKDLRSALDTVGTSLGKKMYLSVAINAGSYVPDKIKAASPSGRDLLKELEGSLDFLSLMTYDFHAEGYPGEKVTNLHSPLRADSNEPKDAPGAGVFNITTAMNSWMKNGFTASKLIAGFPAYGQAYKLKDPVTDFDSPNFDPEKYLYKPFVIQTNEKGEKQSTGTPLYNNNVDGPIHGGSDGYRIEQSITKLKAMGLLKEKFINNAGTCYGVIKGDNGQFYAVSYDKPQSVKLKAQAVVDNGWGGLMCWYQAGDMNSDLISAADSVLHGS